MYFCIYEKECNENNINDDNNICYQ